MSSINDEQRLDQIRATLNIALLAITTHMVERQLPPPVSIGLPSHGNPNIDIRIHDFQLEAWAGSGVHLDRDSVVVQPSRIDRHGPFLHVTQEAHLDSGVVFRLQWAERRVTHTPRLQAVR